MALDEVLSKFDFGTHQLGKDGYAAYSTANYDKVCIIFTDNKPIDAFYKDIDKVCAKVVDVSEETPTIVDESTNNRVAGTTKSGKFAMI